MFCPQNAFRGYSLSLIFIIFSTIFHTSTSTMDCNKAKRDWLSVRFKVLSGTSGLDRLLGQLRPLCPVSGGNSCCDDQMEQEIYAASGRQLKWSLNPWLVSVAQQMESDSVALDYFFRSDLKEARDRLHESFSGIYGYNYKRNHAFFFNFFTDLEDYMAGRRGQLRQLVSNFFDQLRTSIVVLMEHSTSPGGGNAGLSPGIGGAAVPAEDSKRIKCLSESLSRQKPFDSVDRRLSDLLLEAYPPARMLVNSLAAGGKLLRTIAEKTSLRPECIAALARLRYCGPYCGALEAPRSDLCPSACEQFVSTCFATGGPASGQLEVVWGKLIDSIGLASKRLERAFNFPVVNKDLHISLSEAITFVQQKYVQVKATLEKDCSSGPSGALQRGFPGMLPSSSSSHSEASSTGGARPWSYPGSALRIRRSIGQENVTAVNLLRVERQLQPPHRQWGNAPMRMESSNQVAPEFLNWQYPQPQAPSNRQRAPSQPSHVAPPSANARDRLNRWAVQLKTYYTRHKTLFKTLPEDICQKPSTSQDCYSPPPIVGGQIPHEYTAAVEELGVVSSRLQAATAPEGDPEASELGTRTLRDLADHRQNTTAGSGSNLNLPSGLYRQQQQQPSAANQMPPALMPNQWQSGSGTGRKQQSNYGDFQAAPKMENRLNDGMQGSGNYPPGPGMYGEPQPPVQHQPPSRYQPAQPIPDGSSHLQPPSMGSSGAQTPPIPPPIWGGQPTNVGVDQEEGSGVNPSLSGPDGSSQYPPLVSSNQFGQPDTSYQQPPAWQWPPDNNAGVQPPGSSWQQPDGNSVNQWQPQPNPGYLPPSPPSQPQYGGPGGDFEGSGSVGKEGFYPPVPSPIPPAPTISTTITPTTTTTVKPTTPVVIMSTPVTPTEPKKAKPPVEEILPLVTTTTPAMTTTVPPPNFELQQPLPDDEDFFPRRPDTVGPQQPPTDTQFPQPPASPSPEHVEKPPPPQPWDPNANFEGQEGSGFEPPPPDVVQPQPSPGTPPLEGHVEGSPPDCSAMGANSAMDPRCYLNPRGPRPQPTFPQEGDPQGGWRDPISSPGPAESEGSGEFPPPGPMPPYPGVFPSGTPMPDAAFNEFRPDLLSSEYDKIHPKEVENAYGLPSSPMAPATPTPLVPSFVTEQKEIARTPPPDVWVPAPGHQPGQLPDSKLFLPDYPVHHRPLPPTPSTTSSSPVSHPRPLLLLLFSLLFPLVHYGQSLV